MGIRTTFNPMQQNGLKDFVESFEQAITVNDWQTSQTSLPNSVVAWHIVAADEKLNTYTAPGIFGGVGTKIGSENTLDWHTTLYRAFKWPKQFRLQCRFCFGIYAGGYGSEGGDWRLNLFGSPALDVLDETGWYINLNVPQSGGTGRITCTTAVNGNVQNTITGLQNSAYNQYKYIIIDINFDRTTQTYTGFVYNETEGRPDMPNITGTLSGIDFTQNLLKFVLRAKFLWGKAGGGLGWTLIKYLSLTNK